MGHSAWSEDKMLDSRCWMLDARYSEKMVIGDQLSVKSVIEDTG
jgi:hypothetical protein